MVQISGDPLEVCPQPFLVRHLNNALLSETHNVLLVDHGLPSCLSINSKTSSSLADLIFSATSPFTGSSAELSAERMPLSRSVTRARVAWSSTIWERDDSTFSRPARAARIVASSYSGPSSSFWM